MNYISIIRARMAELHVSQTELAERLGLEQPHVSRFLTGRHTPRETTLAKYFKALDLRLEKKIVKISK